jgi:hypothetical protein
MPGGTPPAGFGKGGAPSGATGGGEGGAAPGGALAGLLGGGTVSSKVVALLTANASQYTWVAAAIGSNTAAGYQLASAFPVMSIGGFNGSDPSPTLAQFKAEVAAGKIHYFIGSGSLGPSRGGSSASSSIAAWVAKNFTATTVGGVTLYDLTK